MTAPATERPRTAEQLRAELRAGLETLHAHIRNGDASDDWALLCLIDWRPDLSPWQREELWERFTDALDKLDQIRDDSFDPTQWDEDREVMEGLYEDQAEAVITTLTGGGR